jgi:RNA polymerase sigma-70 factor (ECF subfamily)
MLSAGAMAAFLGRLDAAAKARLSPRAADDLEQALKSARAAWPTLHVADERFCAFLAEHAAEVERLDSLRAPDLYLACACVDGDAAALQAFDGVLGEVAAKLRSVARSDDTLEEAKQVTRQLLLPRGDRPPALADYAGRGDLRGWLRVALGRELVRLLRRGDKSPRLSTGEIAHAADDADDPETAYLKTHYQREFKEAFTQALAQLEANDRRLLRYSVIERLSIDEIARLDRIHRATAARQVARARERLVVETRRVLRERLQVDASRLQSIFGLIESQVDVSVQRLLNHTEGQ